MAKRASDLTHEERSAFEQDVLAATEEEMKVPQPGFAFEFRQAALSGSYPDTEITIRYWDPRYQRECAPHYRIWRDLIDSEGKLEQPAAHAAVLLKVWALGG